MTNETPQPNASNAEEYRPVGLEELNKLFTPLIRAVGNYLSTSYPETKSPADVARARHWGGICADIAHEISSLTERKSPYPSIINPHEPNTLALEKGPLLFSQLPGFLKSTITPNDPPIPDILGLQMAISNDMTKQLKAYATALYDVSHAARQERRSQFSVVRQPPMELLPDPIPPVHGKRFMAAAKVVRSRMQQQSPTSSESVNTGANEQELLAFCRTFHERFLTPASNGDPAAGHQLLRMVFERSATQMLLEGNREGAREIRDFFNAVLTRDFLSSGMKARFDDLFDRIPLHATQSGRNLFHLFSAIENAATLGILTERDKTALSQSGKYLEQAKQSLQASMSSEKYFGPSHAEPPMTTRAINTANEMMRLAKSEPGLLR